MPPIRLLTRRYLQSETGFHFASQDANSSGEIRILPNCKLDFPKILGTRKDALYHLRDNQIIEFDDSDLF